ncbi:MAG: O-antigen/teichoic acid export membrane protein [Gammaproteobacteria bacterium]|jgi:O-antigen/teichoic acid export membrane protein
MTAMHCMLGRILGPASSFVMAVLLARSFGADGSGNFFVVLTLVTAFAIVAKFGLETALQRFVGAEKARDNAAAIVGIYQQSLRVSLALAALLAGLWIAFASPIAGDVLDDPTQLGLLRLLGLLIVPFTVLGINAAMLKALGSPAWGGFFEAAAWPLVTLGLAGLGSINGPPSIEEIALAYLLAAILAAATAHAVVRIKLPRVPKALAMSSRTLYTSCATLTGIELMNFALMWTPFILLPALADATQAGLYNVSHRLAAQLGVLMLAVASITSARFAAHYQQRQNADLVKLAGRATRTQILLGLPPGIVLLLFSEPILAVFGEEFSAATTTLRVLLIGQLINIVTGPVGYLLAMTGYEGPLRKILLATIALMLLMALALIPIFGATGAAATVTAAMLFHNLLCIRAVASRLGLPLFLAFCR